MHSISIHALREEGDALGIFQSFAGIAISIHALREEGDIPSGTARTGPEDFYPRPPRGGRPLKSMRTWGKPRISIHALREEGDAVYLVVVNLVRVISIHALREEGDNRAVAFEPSTNVFLSTPSARRATAKTEKNISAFVSV